MADIAATPDGLDIDFSDRLISGIPEYRQAALSRLSNAEEMIRYNNEPYGIDLAHELGKVDSFATIGIRAASAIMNDERFVSATLTSSSQSFENDVVSTSLEFDIVAEDGTELSLGVLVANGEVVLVP